MIRINLLGQKKARRRGGAVVSGLSGDGAGEKSMAIGGAVIAAAAVLVFFVVHRPLAGEVSELTVEVAKLDAQRKKLAADTKDLKALRAEKEADEDRWDSIERLDQARAVPAWMLWELSNLLTRGRQPQLTDAMKEELKTNLNRPWQEGWDAKHVWLMSFSEKSGSFTLEGGAQSDSDATQFALRMQASMFFTKISPKGGGEVTDKNTGLPYYRFTITGRVRY
jgi:Tfp pilus assembly protein PilN